jgi:starch-binding outer membrane protein, SusD/RagB family
MLMKAEALVQQGNFLPALHLVNTTYMRSHPTIAPADTLNASSFTTKMDMEELVLKERQREFLFEGKRWFDLMRMARRDSSTDRLLVKVLAKYTANIGEIGSKLKDMNALYFPISESELNANSKLVQNPYYDTKY